MLKNILLLLGSLTQDIHCGHTKIAT